MGRCVKILHKDDRVNYFVGGDLFFAHKTESTRLSHLSLVLLIRNRHAKAIEVERSLGIAHRTLMNWLKKFDEEGADAFLSPVVGKKTVSRALTEEKCFEAHRLLGEGLCISQVARLLSLQDSTLRKGVKSGRVLLPREEDKDESVRASVPSTKSERSVEDAEVSSGLGMACTRVAERAAVALGKLDEASTVFEAAQDVQMGGLLVGLPALCDNGLLSGVGRFLRLPKGFYSVVHVLLVLAYMALARLRRPEALRNVPVGEIGKVVGLDRAPEVKTMRAKIKLMAHGGDTEGWMMDLSRTWMQADPDEAGYVYIDGHVRTYHGTVANLPRRYVSRERLCLRGTSDYWVNDALGGPFFVVSQAVAEGLGSAIHEQIVPHLLQSIPNQPSQEELDADPDLYRFVVIFDRECSDHVHFSRLWEQRIAAITYRKNVKDKWPEHEFKETDVTMPGGQMVKMKLASKETTLSAGKKSLPVLEVRRLSDTGHQTAIITTARTLTQPVVAARMFTRWCQENYFAYMMQHYDIDGLVEYGAEEISGTKRVVNPAWRNLDRQVADKTRDMRKKQVKLAQDMSSEEEIELVRKSTLLQEIQAIEKERETLREQRRNTPKKVEISSLPVEKRPTQLAPLSKQLTNTVKMIAYRAETALVALLRKHLKREDDARALVREIFVTAADLIPDHKNQTLTVCLHHMANPVHDRAVAALLEELNKRQFKHPQTGARMIYKLV